MESYSPEEPIELHPTPSINPPPRSRVNLVLGIISTVSLLSNAFLGFQNFQLNQSLEDQRTSTPPASTIPLPSSTPSGTPPNEKNANPTRVNLFQQSLNQSCKQVGETQNTIELKTLPLKFSPSLNVERTICTLFPSEGPDKGSLEIILADKTVLILYDKNSYEGGHGGFIQFGSLPTVIQFKNNITYSIGFEWPDGGPAELGNSGVILRGERRYALTDGTLLFLNTQTEAIPGKDARLLALLEPDSIPCEYDPAKRCIDGNKNINLMIHNRFFFDMAKLEANEQAAVAKITRLLNAVTQ